MLGRTSDLVFVVRLEVNQQDVGAASERAINSKYKMHILISQKYTRLAVLAERRAEEQTYFMTIASCFRTRSFGIVVRTL